MSRFLMFLCLTLGLIVTGCGGDAKKEDKSAPKSGTEADEKGSAAKGSTSKSEGKGEKAEEKKEEKKEEKAEEKKEEKNASVEKKSDALLVSVKLPNMTWGGCEKSVRSALTSANGFENLKTDLKGRTATFTCKSSDEAKKKLSEIATSNKHVEGFEIQ